MFASTRDARSLLKLAFEAAGLNTPSNTYTEKTTNKDRDRRSVVFPVYNEDAEKVITFAKDFFKEAGFTSSTPKITRSPFCYGYGGLSYVRVIAYLDK